MRARSATTPSADELTLPVASARFAAWRRRRRRGERIPADLWSLARVLAEQVGVSQVSQVLHLDYYALKRHLAVAPAVREASDAPGCPTGFLELSLPSSPAGLRCSLEIGGGSGAPLRAELTGMTAAELATVLGALLEKAPCCR